MTHPKPATVLAQLGHYVDPATGGLAPPIQPSTTFARDEGYALINPALTYGRDDNPGYPQVEAVLCALEAGAEALVFPSGMAAIAALFRTLKRGEGIAVQRPIYYGTLAWLAQVLRAPRDRVPPFRRWPIRPASSARCRLRSRRSCGSRRPPTRCWTWSTSPAPPRSRMPPARSSRSTAPRRPRSSPGRSRSAPIWSCTRRPSI